MEIQNALIKSTSLGYEDHGILTCWLHLDFGGSCQGFGGYALDEPIKDREGKFVERVPTVATGKWVKGILEVVGVEKWEALSGKHIRVEREDGWNGKIRRIGHFLEDKWFDPANIT